MNKEEEEKVYINITHIHIFASLSPQTQFHTLEYYSFRMESHCGSKFGTPYLLHPMHLYGVLKASVQKERKRTDGNYLKSDPQLQHQQQQQQHKTLQLLKFIKYCTLLTFPPIN